MRIETIYYLFIGLTTFGLGATVTAYVPFLQSLGLSLGEVGLVNAVFWLVYAGMELPTGMKADGKSRTWSLKCGMVIQLIGSAFYLCATGFWSAMFAEALLAFGMAFVSGAHQAWVVDALKSHGREQAIRHTFATTAMIRGGCMLLGGVFGALLAFVHPRLIWIPHLVLTIPAFILTVRYMDGHGEPPVRVTEKEALRKSLVLLRESRALKWALVAFIVSGMMLPFNHYWAPYFIELAGKSSLTWIWPVMYLSLMPGGWLVRRYAVGAKTEATALCASLVAIGLGMGLIPLMPGIFLPILAVMLHEVGRGAIEPLMDSFVHHRVDSDHRATYASLQGLIGKLGFAVTPLIVWLAIRDAPSTIETMGTVWFVVGFLMTTFALLLWLTRPKPT